MKTEDLVLRQNLTQVHPRQHLLVHELEKQIFTYLHLKYQVKDIAISQDQFLHTLYLPCINKQLLHPQNFFFSHGFGGSSLMKFPVIGHLLKKGNLVLFQIRGMGLNQKKQKYQEQDLNKTQQYFQQGIKCILDFYKPNNATFICHSFSSYITLLFTIRNESLTKKHIKQLLMLSPIGLTTKQEDYKNEIHSCGDVVHTMIHKLGWTFNLTFKSPLRTICSCFKKKLVMNSLKEENLSAQQEQLIYRIIQVLIQLPDGSECLFYKYFEPRVLPKIPLEPLFVKKPQIPIVLVYGGENDWVDRKGAEKVSQRFPELVKIVQIPGITHNIAFHTVQCRQLFQQLFP